MRPRRRRTLSRGMLGAAGPVCLVLAVCLLGGTESFAEACLRLIVQLANIRAQVGYDRFKLRASLEELQALGDQRGHRFCASFLDLASGPVIQLLTERDADLLGHTSNHTSSQSRARRHSARSGRPARAAFRTQFPCQPARARIQVRAGVTVELTAGRRVWRSTRG